MTTPEGTVKAKVDRLLTECDCWYFKAVQTGYGKRVLDYIVCVAGHFAVIETKAKGKPLTLLQRVTTCAILRSGGTVFVISNDDGIAALKRWIDRSTSK